MVGSATKSLAGGASYVKAGAGVLGFSGSGAKLRIVSRRQRHPTAVAAAHA